ncbi:MAG TPA: hypothetical protein VHX13_02615 [Acidobacteriaceae bacterium]|nr:hypothetical protein [Acidobacteriaceae bacterium]
MNFCRRFHSEAFVCLFACAATVLAFAQQGAPSNEPFAGAAGPQQANREGRTELPMVVRKSIAFREIGPAISGGRVTAVAGVAGNPNVYYVGAADGGVFRSDDGGTTWKAYFQHQAVASIGAMAVDPRNPDVVWIGTGEANVRNDISFGDGVYKSTDGGKTWQHLGLDRTYQISAIAIDPLDPSTVFVAAMGSPWQDNAERGVFRTTDGGKTWQKVLYLGPGVGISDLAMNPQNPQILFAGAYKFRRTPWSYAEGGPEDAIYRSVDGGATWQRLSGHGLPTAPVTRIGLAIAPSLPNRVFAVIGSTAGVLWRSDDNGDHWSLVSKDQEVDSRPFYFSHLAVDPRNPDKVFALSNDFELSTDGGHSFHPIAHQIHVDNHAIWIDPAGSGRIIEGNDGGVTISSDGGGHWRFVDNIAIGQFYHVAASDSWRYLVCGGLQDNSGWCGPSRSKNPSGILSRSWFSVNGGDGIFTVPAPDNPNVIYNSTQNSSIAVFNRASEQSRDIEPYPQDFTGMGVAGLKYRFAWDAAFAISPENPAVLYVGGNVVFESDDHGHTWKPISPDLTRNDKSKQQSSGGPVIKDNSGAEVYDAILAIAPSPTDARTIWVGTDDGEVQLTRDGGAHWTNVTANIPNLPGWGRVEEIDVSAKHPGEAFIAVDRHFSGDFKPYLFRTTDYGRTWTSISGNLPSDVYAHVVRQDLHNADLLYAGLENGLYVSWDGGQQWYLFGLELPNAAVYDIQLNAKDNDLIVGTHGRSIWILDDLTPFQQFTPQIGQESAHLFAPEPALRFQRYSPDEELGDSAFYGENPPYGAVLSYFAGPDVKGPGTLVITNAKGQVVRTLKGMHPLMPGQTPPGESDLPPAATAAQTQGQQAEQHEAKPARAAVSTQAQQEPPAEKAGEEAAPKKAPWVSTKPGLQRIVWNLRADGPVRWNAGKSFLKGPRFGPLVPPGTYTAALTIGGQTVKQTVDVVNDPASTGTTQEMEQRYEAAQSVMHELSQLDVALNRLDTVHGQLEALRAAVKGSPQEKAAGEAIDALEKQSKAVEARITSNPGAAESTLRVPDQIHEKVFMMMFELEGEDDAPSAAMLAQNQSLQPDYDAAIRAFNDFLSTDVAVFNRKMSEEKLTGVVAGEALKP